jgi:hypothetical protein
MSLPAAVNKAHASRYKEIFDKENPIVDIEILTGLLPQVQKKV